MATEVTVLRPHSWRGQPYQAGQTYIVEGDVSLTEDAYLGKLKVLGLAEPKAATESIPAKGRRVKSGVA